MQKFGNPRFLTKACGRPIFKEESMSNDKPIKPADNQSNMQNPNKGTAGTNRQYDQNQGNRGGQLNPNRKGK